MKFQRACVQLVLSILVFSTYWMPAPAQTNSSKTKPAIQQTGAERDGQHDFDFEFGSWKAHLRRLLHPLTGSDAWVELEGTSVVRKIWEGRANLGELEVENQSTQVEGMSLRLYNPQSQ